MVFFRKMKVDILSFVIKATPCKVIGWTVRVTADY
jgi:hypothetical protein